MPCGNESSPRIAIGRKTIDGGALMRGRRHDRTHDQRNAEIALDQRAPSASPPIFAASVRVAPLLIAAKANDRPAADL
jgi:hypothetical protein